MLVEEIQQDVAEPDVRARCVQHDRQIVRHRQLDRQAPHEPAFRDQLRIFRRVKRIDEHLAVNSAPPSHAMAPGQVRDIRGGQEKERRVNAHEVPVAGRPSAAAPRVREEYEQHDDGRDDGEEGEHVGGRPCARRDTNHNTMAMRPGKKYGTNPKWRPIAKYSALWANRLLKSFSTFSASDSFVLMPTPCSYHAVMPYASNGNCGSALGELTKYLRSPPWKLNSPVIKRFAVKSAAAVAAHTRPTATPLANLRRHHSHSTIGPISRRDSASSRWRRREESRRQRRSRDA